MEKNITGRWVIFLVGATLSVCSSLANAGLSDDAYLAGYAAAVLEREFHVTARSLWVKNSIITVGAQDLGDADHDQVVAVLSRVPGAQRVEIRDEDGHTVAVADISSPHLVHFQQGNTPQVKGSPSEEGFLPRGQLFRPLLADPRWPNFSATYRYYLDDDELRHVSAANFGGTLALYRNRAPFTGQWEFGLQAGVFSIFDLNTGSKDLINSDFFVAGLTSYRLDDFSAMLRLFHQSSHLGDEFLLRNRVNRINLSYESIDLKLSYQFLDLVRLYGGGGWLFDQEPADLKPWSTQFGVDFESPWLFMNGTTQPIVGADFKLSEEHEWNTDLSIRAGLRFGSSPAVHRKLALMLEYFTGHSPNGQFYQRKIEYIGLGVHYYF